LARLREKGDEIDESDRFDPSAHRITLGFNREQGDERDEQDLARTMLARALDAGVPVGWVTMDGGVRAEQVAVGVAGGPRRAVRDGDPPQRRHDHHQHG